MWYELAKAKACKEKSIYQELNAIQMKEAVWVKGNQNPPWQNEHLHSKVKEVRTRQSLQYKLGIERKFGFGFVSPEVVGFSEISVSVEIRVLVG